MFPAFEPARTAYADTVPTATESLVVKARAADGRVQSITLHGRTFPGDSAEATLPLSPGLNAFDIKVRSEEGGERTYTLRAYRRRGFLRNLGGAKGGPVLQLPDKGYIVLGSTSAGGTSDIYLVRTDANGNPLPGWPKTYARTGSEYGAYLKQNIDGGFEISGWEWPERAALTTLYRHRTDPDGNALFGWPRVSSTLNFGIYDLRPTSDGGFILTGSTGEGDSLVLAKTDALGNAEAGWRKTFKLAGRNFGLAVHQLEDGGYFATGSADNAGDDNDVYLIRTDARGNSSSGWPKSYFNYITDQAVYGAPTRDGGFIVTGFAMANTDYLRSLYLLRIDANGVRLPGWPKTYLMDIEAMGKWVEQTADGGFLVLVHRVQSPMALLVLRMDANGVVAPGWPKTFAGFSAADKHPVKQTADGGFILSGSGAGGLMLLKIDADGNWE